MHMRRAVVSFFGTMTGLATHSDSLSSRINPALRSRLTSSPIALLFGSENRRIDCCTGLAVGSTFRACSASSLGYLACRKWPIQLFPCDPALRCFEGRVGHNDGSLVGILRRQPIFVSQAYLDSIRGTHHTSVCAEVDVVFILPLFK
jgi:hypothetical protein